MTTLKKYNLQGKEVGTVAVEQKFVGATAHSQMVKDYIVAIRANARQWSASTKTRAEVKHTTKKPHKQKGTGRARQGNLVTSQFRGGGIVFGPKPKFDQHTRINKTERKAAIRFLISEKIKNNTVHVLENIELDAPKTKTLVNFINTVKLDRRVLFLGEGNYKEVDVEGNKQTVSVKANVHHNFAKSLRNIPKTYFSLARNINGYDLMIADHLVITEAGLKEINAWLA